MSKEFRTVIEMRDKLSELVDAGFGELDILSYYARSRSDSEPLGIIPRYVVVTDPENPMEPEAKVTAFQVRGIDGTEDRDTPFL